MNFNLERPAADRLLHLSVRPQRRLAIYENAHHRWVEIDDVVQSVLCLAEPARLCLPHQEPLAASLPPCASRVLELGLGGGDMARHLMARWPKVELHCVERDAQMLALYQQFFAQGAPVHLHQADALAFLQEGGDSFDLVLLDLFCLDGNPLMLFQPPLYQALARRLKGRLLINLLPRTRLEEERVEALCRDWLAPARVLPVPGCRNAILVVDYT